MRAGPGSASISSLKEGEGAFGTGSAMLASSWGGSGSRLFEEIRVDRFHLVDGAGADAHVVVDHEACKGPAVHEHHLLAAQALGVFPGGVGETLGVMRPKALFAPQLQSS